MSNSPNSKLLQLAIPIYRMQTQLFNNAIAGIKAEDAVKRLQERTNHIIWITGNMVNCRYWLANLLGIENKDPYEQLFANAKSLDAAASYPSLEQLKKEWHRVSPLLFDRLMAIPDKELQMPFKFGMNVSFIEENKLNMVGMCVDRIAYLLGQMGLMRKALGYDAMKYDLDEKIMY